MPEEKRPSACNCMNLRRASQAITKAYNEALAPSGLTLAQFGLLKHTRSLAPVSVSRLAEVIRLDRTTLVRNLKPLEQSGLVMDAGIRTRDRQLCLTEKGLKALEAAEPYWLKAQKNVEELLGAEDLKVLTGLLSRIETRWG